MSSLGLQISEQLRGISASFPEAAAPPMPLPAQIAAQESQLLSLLYQRLTEPENDEDILPTEVSAIFRYYAGVGDKLNASTVSAANIRKFALDIDLASALHVNKNKAQAIVDILYTRVVRGDAARFGILSLLGENKGLTDGLTFPWFLARLALQIWTTHLQNEARRSHDGAASVVSSLIMPTGEERTAAAILSRFVKLLGGARRSRGLDAPSGFISSSTSALEGRGGDAPSEHSSAAASSGPQRRGGEGTDAPSELLSASALSALKRGEGLLHRLFFAFTTGRGTAAEAMDWGTLAKLAADFNVCPGVISKPAMFACFLAASPAQTPLLFPGFLEVFARIAIHAFSSPAHEPSHPTPGSKIDALFDRIMAAADKLAHLAGMERQKGSKPSAPTRLLSPEAGSGTTPMTSRKISDANVATAREALASSADFAESHTNVEAVARLRNTGVTAALSARGTPGGSTQRGLASTGDLPSPGFSARFGSAIRSTEDSSESWRGEDPLNRSTSALRRSGQATGLATTSIVEEKDSDEDEEQHTQADVPRPTKAATPVPPLKVAAMNSPVTPATGSTALSMTEATKSGFIASPSARSASTGALSRVARASLAEGPMSARKFQVTSPGARSARSPADAEGTKLGYAVPGTELAGSLAGHQIATARDGVALPIPIPAAAVLAASVTSARTKLAPTGHTTIQQLAAMGAMTARNVDPSQAAATAILIAKHAGMRSEQSATTDNAHAKPKYFVDPKVVNHLCAEFSETIPRMQPIFLFYCRIGDPANTGRMSYTNFFKLLRDIKAIDDAVTPGDVNLQLITIARDNAAISAAESKRQGQDQSRREFSPDSSRYSRGSRHRALSAPSRPQVTSTIAQHAPVSTTEHVGLVIEDFLEALVRVSELIRRGHAVSSPSESPSAQVDADAEGEVLESASKFFHTFLSRRILPLMDLPAAEEEIAAMVESSEVVDAMARHVAFIKRLFAFYANDQRDGIGIAVYLPELLQLTRDFELNPDLLNKGDVEAIFFACARKAGTDLEPAGLMGRSGVSGVGGGTGHRRPDATYNSGLALALSGLFSPRVDTNTARKAVSPSKRKGGGHTEAAALSASYRTADSAYLTFPSFAEALARMALIGFARPFLVKRCPEAADKVLGLFQWLYASKTITNIEAADWNRGRTRSGRKLNRFQLSGEGTVAPSTRASIADNEHNASNLSDSTLGAAATRDTSLTEVPTSAFARLAGASTSTTGEHVRIPPPPSPAVFRSTEHNAVDGDSGSRPTSPLALLGRSFSKPDLRVAAISTVETERNKKLTRSGLRPAESNWRSQSAERSTQSRYTSPQKPRSHVHASAAADAGSGYANKNDVHVTIQKPVSKGVPPMPQRPHSEPDASDDLDFSDSEESVKPFVDEPALMQLADALGIDYARPGSPDDLSAAALRKTGNVGNEETRDRASSLVDGYELPDRFASPERRARRDSEPRQNSHNLSGKPGMLRTTDIEYDYTVASAKVCELGSGSPVMRYAKELTSPGSATTGGQGRKLFAPGELQHYARTAAGRTTTQKHQQTKVLRSPSAALSSTSLPPGAPTLTMSLPDALSAIAGVHGPEDPALAAIHRDELVKTVANGSAGRPADRSTSPRRSGSPRLATAERAEQKRNKSEFEEALHKVSTGTTRRASLSTLHQLEQLMAEHGIDSTEYGVPALSHLQREPQAAETAYTSVNAQTATSGSPQRSGKGPKDRGLLVRLPSGTFANVESVRSPLAATEAFTWVNKLRSTPPAAQRPVLKQTRSMPSAQSATPKVKPPSHRKGSWLAQLAEDREASEKPEAPPAVVVTQKITEEDSGTKTIVTTKSFRVNAPASELVPPKTLPGWASTLAHY